LKIFYDKKYFMSKQTKHESLLIACSIKWESDLFIW